jgi:hypothetical protein
MPEVKGKRSKVKGMVEVLKKMFCTEGWAHEGVRISSSILAPTLSPLTFYLSPLGDEGRHGWS